MAIFNQNISLWHEDLKYLAIRLVKDEEIWKYENGKFNPGDDMEGLKLPQKFKIISNVGLEILTKSVCLKRNIDIFKNQKQSVTQNSPFGIAGVIAPQNPWLESIIQTYGYNHLGDIHTVEFYQCIEKLKQNLSQTVTHKNYDNLMDDINEWRQFHRNTEVHLSLPLMFPAEYETNLRELYNGLLEVYDLT
ncbi:MULTISPECIES: hypothetical protein [unclassified Mesobacillus]|uniref:hypothetical protein n=1 Tax=unclassified Mesobacillus TaxID=2675270 RepID=UPI00203D4229|nr:MULTISPECIES: hypothetical protein [unclassified Mesobacillus]MCM3122751.1 hypothetical protein [Mesobacillus sp. MER 33]MCM3232715.1 hypothetical protein [Mesobacillus sp. MER 48]